VFVKATT